jgi:hypothetical protein
VDLRGVPEISMDQRRRARPVSDVRQHAVRAGVRVTPPLSAEIDAAITDYTAASTDEVRAFTEETGRSTQFQREVAAATRMLIENGCVSETLWALMIVMIRTGMAIERKRHEIDVLKQMYEGGAA